MFSFAILSGIFFGGGILAKLLTISSILVVNQSLSTGIIILGGVSFMMGVFATVVFRRQAFAEKDLRHYLENAESLTSSAMRESNVN